MMTYLKKGSAVVVVGEIGPPQIYTDREGKPQVSLEITAEIIRFSPFGKPDRGEQQQQAGANPAYGQQASPGASHGQGGFGEQSFGSPQTHGTYGAPPPSYANANSPNNSQNLAGEEPLPF